MVFDVTNAAPVVLAVAVLVILLGTGCFLWDRRRRRCQTAADVRDMCPQAPTRAWRGLQNPGQGVCLLIAHSMQQCTDAFFVDTRNGLSVHLLSIRTPSPSCHVA